MLKMVTWILGPSIAYSRTLLNRHRNHCQNNKKSKNIHKLKENELFDEVLAVLQSKRISGCR